MVGKDGLWGTGGGKMSLFSCICSLNKEKERRQSPSFQHPVSAGLGGSQARANQLGKGVSVEGNGRDLVFQGEEVSHVPGPKADTTPVPQLHQGEARRGVLSRIRGQSVWGGRWFIKHLQWVDLFTLSMQPSLPLQSYHLHFIDDESGVQTKTKVIVPVSD